MKIHPLFEAWLRSPHRYEDWEAAGKPVVEPYITSGGTFTVNGELQEGSLPGVGAFVGKKFHEDALTAKDAEITRLNQIIQDSAFDATARYKNLAAKDARIKELEKELRDCDIMLKQERTMAFGSVSKHAAELLVTEKDARIRELEVKLAEQHLCHYSYAARCGACEAIRNAALEEAIAAIRASRDHPLGYSAEDFIEAIRSLKR